jgi:hypothetical protein
MLKPRERTSCLYPAYKRRPHNSQLGGDKIIVRRKRRAAELNLAADLRCDAKKQPLQRGVDDSGWCM